MDTSHETAPPPKAKIRTLRFKVHPDGKSWLDQAAVEVNFVWNYLSETCVKAARPCTGTRRWLSSVDLCALSAGASSYFAHIGADTIQALCREYAQKRSQAKLVRLRWRVSRGPQRSLGWVPFKAASLRRHGKYVRFCGKTLRFFESKRLEDIQQWRQGCFAQDAVGDWYLCLPVEYLDRTPAPERMDVGAGSCVQIVSERNTSRTCSSCGLLTGPRGVNELRIRDWICSGCGAGHDRDRNGAENIRLAGRMRPSLRKRGTADDCAA